MDSIVLYTTHLHFFSYPFLDNMELILKNVNQDGSGRSALALFLFGMFFCVSSVIIIMSMKLNTTHLKQYFLVHYRDLHPKCDAFLQNRAPTTTFIIIYNCVKGFSKLIFRLNLKFGKTECFCKKGFFTKLIVA